MKNKHCEWCDHTFQTDIAHKIYCSEDCRNAATKEKIANRYLLIRRTSPNRKKRKCKQCEQPLSIYNDESLCERCLVNPNDVAKALKEIKGILNDK